MTCNHLYSELSNRCKNFLYSVEMLYYTTSKFKDFESYYYPNLKRLIKVFVEGLDSDTERYKRCIDLSELIKNIERYLDQDPDRSLLYIYDFCSKFE